MTLTTFQLKCAFAAFTVMLIHTAYAGGCAPAETFSITFEEIDETRSISDLRIGDGAIYFRGGKDRSLIHVVDVSDPTAPRYATSFNRPGFFRDMWFDDQTLFISGNEEGVQIYDCSNPLAPTLAGTADTIGETPFIRAANGLLYVISADSFNYLLIYDITAPASPVHLSTTPIGPLTFGSYDSVSLSDGLLFIEDGRTGGEPGFIVDARDPTSPAVIHTFPGFAEQVDVSATTAFRTFAENSLVAIYDVAQPDQPRLLNRLTSLPNFVEHIIADPPFIHILRVDSPPSQGDDLRTYLYSRANRTQLAGTTPVPQSSPRITSSGRVVYAYGKFPHLSRFELPECPGLCGTGDLALPLGTLDLSDISTFTSTFSFQQSAADFAEPFGVFDLADIVAFVTAFNAGCP